MDQYLCDHHIKVYYNIEKRKFLAQFYFDKLTNQPINQLEYLQTI